MGPEQATKPDHSTNADDCTDADRTTEPERTTQYEPTTEPERPTTELPLVGRPATDRRPALDLPRPARPNALEHLQPRATPRCQHTRTFTSLRPRVLRSLRLRTERGAATAEYAVTIVAACTIGGALVVLLRSPAMTNALKSIINYALKIAGVEGVHL
ncbi:DUF4244 domain-containing protein [Kribbella solani]|uniref:DUF4244 domain-containing protein n=1 Tax=Kribbella solani TaxID=236067 RepID=A0A841DQE9_9ACTN|nr:DUF4244 domain-containing protein [Kribbella solani]MBB5981364.1 hypothetical protein [Kribbella solani]